MGTRGVRQFQRVRKHTISRGVSCFPRIFLYFRLPEIASGAFSGTTVILLKYMYIQYYSADTLNPLSIFSVVPGRKGPRARMNISQNPAENARLSLVSYRAVTPQTVHFRLDRKLKDHGVASTLRTFEPSAPRLQCPGSRSATNLVNCRNAIVFFLALDHTHCHPAARARLSGTCILPPKSLNNAKYRTASAVLFARV
jgi:hypothetical protein